MCSAPFSLTAALLPMNIEWRNDYNMQPEVTFYSSEWRVWQLRFDNENSYL